MIVYTLIIRRLYHAQPRIPFAYQPHSPPIFFHLDQRYSMEYAHTSMYVQHTDTCKSYTCNSYFIGLLLSVYILLLAMIPVLQKL